MRSIAAAFVFALSAAATPAEVKAAAEKRKQ
jgi:hypothetical protein